MGTAPGSPLTFLTSSLGAAAEPHFPKHLCPKPSQCHIKLETPPLIRDLKALPSSIRWPGGSEGLCSAQHLTSKSAHGVNSELPLTFCHIGKGPPTNPRHSSNALRPCRLVFPQLLPSPRHHLKPSHSKAAGAQRAGTKGESRTDATALFWCHLSQCHPWQGGKHSTYALTNCCFS